MKITRKSSKMLMNAVSMLFIALALLFIDVRSADAATEVTVEQISDDEKREYVNNSIYGYLFEPEIIESLNNGESIVFMFEGASDNAQTIEEYERLGQPSNYFDKRTSAVCIVIKNGPDGQPNIVFFNDYSTTFPSYPTEETGEDKPGRATVSDGCYKLRTWNHNSRYAAVQLHSLNCDNEPQSHGNCECVEGYRYKNGKFSSSDKLYGINIHTRGNCGLVNDNNAAWSEGCFSVDYYKEDGSNRIPAYEDFLQVVLPKEAIDVLIKDMGCLGADSSKYKAVKISKFQGEYENENILVGLVVVDRFLYREELKVIYGNEEIIDNIVKASEEKLEEHSDFVLKLSTTSIKEGNDINIAGYVESPINIKQITADIYDSENNRVIGTIYTTNKSLVRFLETPIASYLKFNTLKAGDYVLRMCVKDERGYTRTKSQEFTVHASGLSSSVAIGVYMSDETVVHGMPCEIYGTISSQLMVATTMPVYPSRPTTSHGCPVKYISGVLTTTNGVFIASAYCVEGEFTATHASNSTRVNIANTSINSELAPIISGLKQGEYRLIISATNVQGVSASKTINFSVSEHVLTVGPLFPTSINHKKDNVINGSVESSTYLETISANVVTASGNSVSGMSKTVDLSGKKKTVYSLKDSAIDTGLNFKNLDAGNYKLVITATNNVGMYQTKEIAFSVVHTLTLSPSFEAELEHKTEYNISGKVESCCELDTVSASIVSVGGGNAIKTKSVKPSGKTTYSFKNSTIDSALKIKDLDAGSYVLVFTATNKVGEYQNAEIPFKVEHYLKVEPTFVSTVFYGKDSTIGGSVKSCCKLNEVSAVVTQSGSEKMSTVVYPTNGTSVNFTNSKINTNLKFNTLGIGKYKLNITATAQSGLVANKTLDFEVEHYISVSPTLAKSKITEGSGCTISGTVKSSCKITSISGTITTAAGAYCQSKNCYPNKTSVSIADTIINSGLKFGKLAVGNYKLIISAVNEVGQVGSETIEFTIVKKTVGTLTIDAELDTYEINYGSGCNIKGSITSGYNITTATGTIVPAGGGNAVQTIIIEPNCKTVNIINSDLNYKLTFGSLSRGTYYLTISAVDSNGKSAHQDIKFTIK